MYCIYLRKSRADLEAEARGEGETLAVHRKRLIELAERRGLPIGEIYAEVLSGDTIADRPEMQRLLRDLERGRWEGVLCNDIDRLGRGDGSDQARILKTFKFTGARIITPYKDYDPRASESDEEHLEFEQQFARFEYRHIKRRMWAGRVASAQAGYWQSPKAPFGYRRVRVDNSRRCTLEPDPAEAEAVRMVYDLYGAGDAGKQIIANRLNDMGFRTLSGRLFDMSAVGTMLRNPVYLGKVRWNYRRQQSAIVDGVEVKSRPRSDECMICDGLHPALITQAQWDAVQTRLAGHPEVRCHRGSDLRNPLAGLLVCGECGRAMVMTPLYHRRASTAYRCVTHGCPTSGIDASYVLGTVKSVLERWATLGDRPEDAAGLTDVLPSTAQQLDAARTTLNALESQQERLQDLLETGVYDTQTYLQRMAKLKPRLTAAREELAELNSRRDPIAAIIAMREDILHVLDVWDASGAAELNILLKRVIDHIIYRKARRCTRADDPSAFLEMTVYPRT